MVGMVHREKLNGNLDRVYAAFLQERLEGILEGGASVELDASGVTYVSSDGLRMLMRLNHLGEITLTRAGEELCELFDAADLSSLIRTESMADRLSRLFTRRARRCLDALPVSHRMSWQVQG